MHISENMFIYVCIYKIKYAKKKVLYSFVFVLFIINIYNTHTQLVKTNFCSGCDKMWLIFASTNLNISPYTLKWTSYVNAYDAY